MLGPSAEESEIIATEHLHYLERLAKFSLDLNIYNIPIVQETFQKLVSITGTRRFLQRAEAFERFLSMLSRRTLNSNYYLNRQYHEDMNSHNTNMYGYYNYDYDYNRRLQNIHNENIYHIRHFRIPNENINTNINVNINPNLIYMSNMNMNRYIRQPYMNQRGIPNNNSLNNIEEEEEEEEIDQEENNNLSINSESSSTLSLREDYSLYASSAHHHHHQRSHPLNHENYITRVHLSNFQRVPSHIPENRNRNHHHHSNNNSDIKINEDLYPENNHNHVSNPISDIRSHNNTTTDNSNNNNDCNNNNSNNTNDTNSTNDTNCSNDTNNNSINNDQNNIVDISGLNKEELKYNTQSYKNINVKLYEDLNILTPPATDDDDDIPLKNENESDNQKLDDQINTSLNSEVNDSKVQNLLVIPSIEQQKIFNNNIPKEEITEKNDSSNKNTINKQSDSSLNIENKESSNH
eukprot:jgi/Orpsp1_1/1186030/evm.model.c7180000096550.1